MRLAPSRTFAVVLVAGLVAPGCAGMGKQLVSNKESQEDQEDLVSKLSLARLTERHGENGQARMLYEAIQRDYPDNKMVYHRLGVLDASDGNHEGAAQHFEKAIALGDPSSDLLRDYGYMMYLQERMEEAERLTRDSLAKSPRNKAARNNLGLILAEQGKFDEALAEFRKNGDEAEALANMAYAYSLVNDFDSAEQHYHRALELDNSLKPAAEGLVQLAELRDRRMTDARVKFAATQPKKVRDKPASPEALRLENAMISSITEQPSVRDQRSNTRMLAVRQSVNPTIQIPNGPGQNQFTATSMQPPLTGTNGQPLTPNGVGRQVNGNQQVAPQFQALPNGRYAAAQAGTAPAEGQTRGTPRTASPGTPQMANNSNPSPYQIRADQIGMAQHAAMTSQTDASNPGAPMNQVQQAVGHGFGSAMQTHAVAPAGWNQTTPWQVPTWTPPPAGTNQ